VVVVVVHAGPWAPHNPPHAAGASSMHWLLGCFYLGYGLPHLYKVLYLIIQRWTKSFTQVDKLQQQSHVCEVGVR
jgi:hypothetical protein